MSTFQNIKVMLYSQVKGSYLIRQNISDEKVDVKSGMAESMNQCNVRNQQLAFHEK